ncbi:MAG: ABC transporter permease [Calditrichaeota bacterium]|nr:ABC transporter permease [Calditrichota bacterium]
MNALRPVLFLIEKEFRQVFRDPIMLRMLFVLPVMQLFLFGYAVTTDIKNVRLALLDRDRTPASRHLAEAFYAGEYFKESLVASSEDEIDEALVRGRADIALTIPKGYGRALETGQPATIGLLVDGVNSSLAGRARSYAEGVIRKEAFERVALLASRYPDLMGDVRRIEAVTRVYYNPQLESRFYMIPAILVMIITIVSGMMTGMAVVREREIGTLEFLRVSPLKSWQIVIGKTIPFVVLAFVELSLAAVVAILWFKLRFAGSVLNLALASAVYLLVTLGSGLLVSTAARTQQQAMLTIWFFLVFGILMSGFFFPVENMPENIRLLTYLNPLRYFMAIVRGIFLKGTSLVEMLPDLVPLSAIGLAVFTLAVVRFGRKE